MTFTPERLSQQEIAWQKVKELLEKYGCRILDMRIPKDLSLKELDADLKQTIGKIKATKFDLLVTRQKEHYLVEVKYKSKIAFKTWVDKNSYDVYHEMACKLGFPFLYFVYVDETEKIYRHEVSSPENFKSFVDRKRQTVYLIPEEKFHEVEPSFTKRLDTWCRM